MADECCATLTCPVGNLLLTSRAGRLTGIELHAPENPARCPASAKDGSDASSEAILAKAKNQLDEYFAGHRKTFDLPLDLSGCPPFTRRVLETLQRVAYGETLSYGELAARAGSPRGARAIGQAMAANPLPIVVPCHRVVAADGRLGGYSGGAGLPTKQWLLAFEQSHCP